MEAWRHNLLQQGISGAALIYGGGNVGRAVQEFPPSAAVLQDTFAELFRGPEDGATSSAQREATARHALCKEMQPQVKKPLFGRQAKQLLSTNCVYAENAKQRTDLIEKLPETSRASLFRGVR